MINKENLIQFAWTNVDYIKKKISAVMLDFGGLNSCNMKIKPSQVDLELGDSGILTITSYLNPWSWMNNEAISFTDTILDLVYEKYDLSCDVPLIATGGSMGGLCALIYCIYGKYRAVACYANSPVCDLLYHKTERNDLPRTIYSAFSSYACGIDAAVIRHSPAHQVEKMPLIPYLIIHGEKDSAVNKEQHSDVFVKKMIDAGHNVEYIVMNTEWHCSFNDYNTFRRTIDFIKDVIR